MLILLYAFIILDVVVDKIAAGLLIEPKYQLDLIEGLHITNTTHWGVSLTQGYRRLSPAILLSGDSRQLQLPSEVLTRATYLLSQSNEFTLMATLRQQEKNTGTILAFSEGNNRLLELQSSGRRDEIRLHYLHRNTVFVETFPYRLADNSWHQLAITISGNIVDLFVDCNRIYRRLIHELDAHLRGHNLSLWLGQRNARHFLFKGTLQDVKMVASAHGYLTQCPHLDTECPTCGQFRQLQMSVFHLENYINRLTEKLTQTEARLAKVEECECQKSCRQNNTVHPDGAMWQDGCEICSCVHGEVKCRPVQCPLTSCKNPVQEDGECCPTCLKQCLLRGVLYDHGEQFNPKQCVQCECHDGSMQCKRIDPKTMCSPLRCPESEQFNVPGECCRYCPGVDYCSAGHDCDVNATCLNLQTRYACQCIQGYQGDGKHCADVDECLKRGGHNGHHCHDNTVCTNLPGSYVCDCIPGYKRLDAYNCVEHDECNSEDHRCDSHAHCTNTQGSYTCTCEEGYYGDGFTCHPICNQTCLNGGQCVAPGQCFCLRGYTGPSCEFDMDECSLGLHRCHSNSRCVNVAGWYYCECRPGYESKLLDNNLGVLCQDVDECMLDKHTCHGSASCINLQGGYRCECTRDANCSLDCLNEKVQRSNGEKWSPESCRTCTCRDGVVDCQDVQCDCNDPDPVCCPQCDRTSYCHHQEAPTIFRNGDRWTYQCQTCECLYGEIDCWAVECPPTNCLSPVWEPGSCCPICRDDPCTDDNGTQSCNFLGKTYVSGERVPMAHDDPCASCNCKNGQLCCTFVCPGNGHVEQQQPCPDHSKEPCISKRRDPKTLPHG